MLRVVFVDWPALAVEAHGAALLLHVHLELAGGALALPAVVLVAEAVEALAEDEAQAAYKRVINEFFYAQCWDPGGWFWKPSEAAQQKLGELDNV